MKDFLIPLVSILSSAFVSVFISLYNVKNERKKLTITTQLDNKTKQITYFSELIATLDSYFIASDNENKNKVVKAVSQFMPYAPLEFHEPLFRIMHALDEQGRYTALEYKKKLFDMYSKYIQSSAQNTKEKKHSRNP